MKLTVLGCSGTFPGPDTGCSAYLLQHEGFTVLIDVGSGAIGELQHHADLFGVDAVFLSHLHADHCLDLVGYTYARRYCPGEPPPVLPVYGPAGTRARLSEAGGWPAADRLEEVYDFRTVTAGRLEIGPFTVDLATMNHPVRCHGSRWSAGGRSLTYSGDTGVCDELVSLAQGTDLALFEASWYDGDENPPGVHLTGRQAGEHAARAQAERLLLTHITPWGDRQRSYEEASPAFRGALDVAVRGVVYEV